jgi:hypothetical protein
MEINIRLATSEDVEKIIHLICETYGDLIEFNKSRFEHLVNANFAVIAEDTSTEDNRIVGRILFIAKENPKLGVGEFEGGRSIRRV